MEDGRFIQIFKDEALELLGQLEDSLLELEASPKDEELISAVFRVMHTIKGSAGMVGLEAISEFTHEVESIFEEIRSGNIIVSKSFIDYTLRSRDIILEMINDPDYRFQDSESFFSGFKNSINKRTEITKTDLHPKTYRIIFKPDPEIFFTGTDPLRMIQEILELGEGVVMPFYREIPKFTDFIPQQCYIYWEIYLTTTEKINKIHDVFIFLNEKSSITVEEWNHEIEDPNPQKLGHLLVKSGLLKDSDINNALDKQPMLGEILIKKDILTKHEVKNALKAQSYINEKKSNKVETKISNSLRINSNKLDSLIDLVGEIVTIYAQMLQMSHESEDSKLVSIIERFGMLTEDLRDTSMSMRMVPIGSTFSRFKRLVRDLSGELGKKIELVTEGAETELDKNVIEQLNEPLVHIIRNCIDHGIESPEIRTKNGKSESGVIKLSAIHSGTTVQIVIEDNGGGLSRDKIYNKAISRGLIQKTDEISNKDLFNLIFAPGFSTAENITKVSGRGVGLDAVKKQIELLKGHVYIDSKEGEFTKFTLVLPITLAIIEGLLVQIEKESFVIPLGAVEACVELMDENKDLKSGRNVITFRDKLVPYIDLRKFFSIKSQRQTIEQIVIVNSNHRQIGLLVDSVIGSHQTVIKSLGNMYRGVQEISGAAILGNGSVALVFDVEKLVRVVEKTESIYAIT
ncbi:MAG: chemotaxis protein CheA [Spirochaetaceae bacterium]